MALVSVTLQWTQYFSIQFQSFWQILEIVLLYIWSVNRYPVTGNKPAYLFQTFSCCSCCRHIFVPDSMALFIQICAVGSKKMHLFCTKVHFGHSRSSKVDFGTNQKRVCDFVLVGYYDYGPILCRFWDMTTYWLKIAYFSYPFLIRRPHCLCSLWIFLLKLTVRKLESWGYPPVKTTWL